MLLDGKVAVVTGGASPRGIGYATAKTFAEHGARVVILDVDGNGAAESALSIGAENIGLACNVADHGQCRQAAAVALEKMGKIDILINNAGITEREDVWKIDGHRWDRMIDINLKGVFNLSQAVMEHMMARGSGCIASTSSGSIHSGGGFVGGAHYVAAKGGVVSLGRAMARELGPYGIRVNTIAPGLVVTDMATERVSDELFERVRNLTLLKRLASPQDIANAFLFLSCDLSSYITGCVIDVNGGLFLQ